MADKLDYEFPYRACCSGFRGRGAGSGCCPRRSSCARSSETNTNSGWKGVGIDILSPCRLFRGQSRKLIVPRAPRQGSAILLEEAEQ